MKVTSMAGPGMKSHRGSQEANLGELGFGAGAAWSSECRRLEKLS
jgi:hypothetical protein